MKKVRGTEISVIKRRTFCQDTIVAQQTVSDADMDVTKMTGHVSSISSAQMRSMPAVQQNEKQQKKLKLAELKAEAAAIDSKIASIESPININNF